MPLAGACAGGTEVDEVYGPVGRLSRALGRVDLRNLKLRMSSVRRELLAMGSVYDLSMGGGGEREGVGDRGCEALASSVPVLRGGMQQDL